MCLLFNLYGYAEYNHLRKDWWVVHPGLVGILTKCVRVIRSKVFVYSSLLMKSDKFLVTLSCSIHSGSISDTSQQFLTWTSPTFQTGVRVHSRRSSCPAWGAGQPGVQNQSQRSDDLAFLIIRWIIPWRYLLRRSFHWSDKTQVSDGYQWNWTVLTRDPESGQRTRRTVQMWRWWRTCQGRTGGTHRSWWVIYRRPCIVYIKVSVVPFNQMWSVALHGVWNAVVCWCILCSFTLIGYHYTIRYNVVVTNLLPYLQYLPTKVVTVVFFEILPGSSTRLNRRTINSISGTTYGTISTISGTMIPWSGTMSGTMIDLLIRYYDRLLWPTWWANDHRFSRESMCYVQFIIKLSITHTK